MISLLMSIRSAYILFFNSPVFNYTFNSIMGLDNISQRSAIVNIRFTTLLCGQPEQFFDAFSSTIKPLLLAKNKFSTSIMYHFTNRISSPTGVTYTFKELLD